MLKKARRVLEWTLSRTIGAIVCGLVVLASLQVLLRYVFNASLLWVEEVSVMALIWLAWIGIIYLWIARAHITVELLSEALPPAGKRRLEIAIEVLALAAGIALILVSLSTLDIYAGMQLGSLEIDASLKYYPITVGGFGLALAAAINLCAVVGGEDRDR